MIASEGLNVAASMVGKVKTVFQMIAIGWLVMQWWGAEILLWIATFLTLYSGLEYIRAYIKKQAKG